MNLTSAAIELSNALKTTTLAWDQAQEHWRDSVSQHFAENHWDPLEEQVRGVINAMDRLSPILAKAVRDCS